MSQMKSLAQSLHDKGVCDPPTCTFCDPSLLGPVHAALSPRALAPTIGSRTEESSHLDKQMLMHTIMALRRWNEEELAMQLTNTTLIHDPSAVGAIAAAWMD